MDAPGDRSSRPYDVRFATDSIRSISSVPIRGGHRALLVNGRVNPGPRIHFRRGRLRDRRIDVCWRRPELARCAEKRAEGGLRHPFESGRTYRLPADDTIKAALRIRRRVAKRALVSGITGQDGSYMAVLLLAKGYDVYGLVRRLSVPNLGNIRDIADKVTLIDGDL